LRKFRSTTLNDAIEKATNETDCNNL